MSQMTATRIPGDNFIDLLLLYVVDVTSTEGYSGSGNRLGLSLSGRTVLNIERRNERLARTLRVTQKELKVVGGNKIQTRIEVIDNFLPSSPTVFSVKHTHGNPWGRQMIVHKNLLLACILTGITDWPLEIPIDSKKMFENTENVPHMHSYMERILPHIRWFNLKSFLQGISISHHLLLQIP